MEYDTSTATLNRTVLEEGKGIMCATEFKPTTSLLSKRYEDARCVVPDTCKIEAGLFSYGCREQSPYLPGWTMHIQPEGKTYFVFDTSPKVVTEEWIYVPDIYERTVRHIYDFKTRLERQGVQLPASAELYLELAKMDNRVCLYYLVDYENKVEFWIEETSGELLSLPLVASESHLRMVLEEHFWTHVEHFPAHRCDVSLDVDRLLHIFLQGRADQLTSATSTFPYTASQCTEVVEILSAIKRETVSQDTTNASCAIVSPATMTCSPISKYSIALIARFWLVICHSRFNSHYGQEYPRLSSDQSILESPAVESLFLFATLSHLMLGFPAAYLTRFNYLFLDCLVYEQHWREFMRSCHQEWSRCALVALALIFVSLATILIPSASGFFVALSLLLSNGALLASAVLLVKNQYSDTHSASDAADFLSDVQGEVFGFQAIALLFSAPKALVCWALLSYSMNTLFWLTYFPLLVAITAGVLVLVALAFTLYKLAMVLSRLAKAVQGFSVRCMSRRKTSEGPISV